MSGDWSIPDCELGPVLGRGGFATVYRARQVSLGRDVAVKVLSAALMSAGDRRRFDRERAALGRLAGHPHVVDVHTAGLTDAAHPYLVMRLYPGGTLADRLRRGPTPTVAEVCDAASAVASALDHAHAHGILHRDVKPANVLFDEAGRAVLTDFGIAGLLQSEDAPADGEPSGRSTVMLTYSYAAPEVVRGLPATVASDVYSLAATVYQLLSGAPPFRVVNPADVLAVLDRPPAPIDAPGVPAAVGDVVLAGLAKDAAHRPASAGAFAAALVSAATTGLNPLPPVSSPPVSPHVSPPVSPPVSSPAVSSPPADPPAPARRGRRRGLVAGAVLAVSLVALAVVLWPRSAPGTPDASYRFSVRRGAALAQDKVDAVSWSPDGTTVATAGLDGPVRLWNPTTGAPIGRVMSGHQTYVYSVDWSPDGRTLASSGLDGTVRLWDATTQQQVGRPRSLGSIQDVYSVAWSPDGKVLASGEATSLVRLWAAGSSTGTGRPLVGHTDKVVSVAWSPDGRRLASASFDGTVRLWDPATGAAVGRPLTGDGRRVQAVAWAPDGRTLASAGDDGTVRLWDPGAGRQIGEPLSAGDGVAVHALAWRPDGTVLAAGDRQGITRLWDPATRRQVSPPITDGGGLVGAVSWSPDGRHLVVGDQLEAARVWSLS